MDMQLRDVHGGVIRCLSLNNFSPSPPLFKILKELPTHQLLLKSQENSKCYLFLHHYSNAAYPF